MTAPFLSSRDKLAEALYNLTWRGSFDDAEPEVRESYEMRANTLLASGVVRDVTTLADDLNTVGETAWVLCEADPTIYGPTTHAVRKVLTALAAASGTALAATSGVVREERSPEDRLYIHDSRTAETIWEEQ